MREKPMKVEMDIGGLSGRNWNRGVTHERVDEDPADERPLALIGVDGALLSVVLHSQGLIEEHRAAQQAGRIRGVGNLVAHPVGSVQGRRRENPVHGEAQGGSHSRD